MAALSSCALLVTGCDIYDESLLTETNTNEPGGAAGAAGTAGGAGGAGTAGSAGGGGDYFWNRTNACPLDGTEVLSCGDSGEGCASEGKPSSEYRLDTDPAESERPFYIGMTRIRLGSVNDDVELSPNDDAWETIGFDVDGVCTNSSTCGFAKGDDLVSIDSCRAPGTPVPFDGDGCRDNLVGQLFKIAGTSTNMIELGFTEQAWNCAMYAGWMTLIFKVSDYSGESNDDSVRLDVYSSIGISNPAVRCDEGPNLSVQDDWWGEAPWISSDPWQITRRSISPLADQDDFGNELPDAVVSDPNAYVRNNWLVAKLPEGAELWLDGQRAQSPGIRFILRRGVMAAKLAKDPQSGEWSIDEGTIGGAMLNSDIVTVFRELGFCENFCNAYKSLTGYVTSFSDILASTEETLPDADCDAMSIGMAFKGRQVTARAEDIVDALDPVECPDPRHPNQPKQGCTCQPDGITCE